MPANRAMWSRVAAVAVTALLILLASTGIAAPAEARRSPAPLMKYYQVADSYAGQPENLAEIAERFLGNSARANEILDLNVGRTQPDAGMLTDAYTLHEGWFLVLPWDAVGDGVVYGELPTDRPGGPVLPSSPVASSEPTAAAMPTPSMSAPEQCARPPQANPDPWAQLRLAPQQAWSHTRGDGVTVAVIDSGVAANVPQLAGSVGEGADVVHGSGKGSIDCLGSGTAMAGLIAGQGDGAFVGIAPGATIVPFRIVTDVPSAKVADQAAALDLAVAAGATVIALGSFVDISQPRVQQAVTNAANHDVVVVLGALRDKAVSLPNQVVRVGAIGVQGTLDYIYPPGSVDVTAPGVDVTSVDIAGGWSFRGTGTQYAVGFVAGVAALVRSMNSRMSSSDVVRRIEQSSNPTGNSPVPDPTFGWGLINPARAVAFATESASAAASRQASDRGGSASAVVIVVGFILVVAGVLMFRVRGKFPSLRNANADRLPVGPPEEHPPPNDRPPGMAQASLGRELRATSTLPRRVPSPRSTMAVDDASSSRAVRREPIAAFESRADDATIEIAVVRDGRL